MRLALALLVLAATAAPALAQEVKVISTSGKWTAYSFQEDGQNVCYIAAKPIKSEGNYKARGEVMLMVTHRPAEKAVDVVSMVAGYAYKRDTDATLQVGSRKFELFTFDDRAWARDGATDKALVQAMTKGNSMTVRGSSSRGTLTTDTFSLQGFTAAYKAIGTACNIAS
jgi:invasion protein IalB